MVNMVNNNIYAAEELVWEGYSIQRIKVRFT